MAQDPNIELRISDLPRPTAAPGPARRWSQHRPGELDGPADVPWGGAFGTPGPDTGYVLLLLRAEDLPLAAGESRPDAVAALAALAGARASLLGRAPVPADIAVARLLLGYSTPAGDTAPSLQERSRRVAGAARHAGRRSALVGAVDISLLEAPPDEVAARLADGAPPFPGS